MAIEDAIRELTEAVKGSDESPETEVTYIEAPANPSDGDTLTYDATSGKWVAGASQSGGFQLYGPYECINNSSYTIESGATWWCELDIIRDPDGNRHTLMGAPESTYFFLVSMDAGSYGDFNGYELPINNGEWYNPNIGLLNPTDTSLTINPGSLFLNLLSTNPLPFSEED